MNQEDKLQSDCFVWHWNTYPEQRRLLYMNYNNPPSAKRGAQLKAMGLVAGVSDMTYLTQCGKVVFIEFKDGSKQSEQQKKFEQAVTILGHQYHIVTDFEQFKALICSFSPQKC